MTNSFDINQFNTLIQQATDSIMCNSDCKNKREAEKLKQTYLDSQTNLAKAPNNLMVAQKNYIEFTEGTTAYNELLESQLQEKANMIANEFSANFDNEVDKVKSQIKSYDGLLLSYKYSLELLRKYNVENEQLFLDLKKESNDVLTNERKTYYEDQQIDSLKFYYHYFLLGIYAICVLCFFIFSFIYPSQSSWKFKLFLTFIFVILPFFSTWILGMFIYFVLKIYNMLPKNVYHQADY